MFVLFDNVRSALIRSRSRCSERSRCFDEDDKRWKAVSYWLLAVSHPGNTEGCTAKDVLPWLSVDEDDRSGVGALGQILRGFCEGDSGDVGVG
jgi:hypothetical protein